MKKYNIAVIGATGSVGQEVLNILHQRKFAVGDVYAIASLASIGKRINFGDQVLDVSTLDNLNYRQIDIAFFCAGEEIAKEHISKFAAAGCLCIDKSSVYRMNNEVPLIVPEANLKKLKNYTKNIIANPNCCTIPLAVVLKPLDEYRKIKRVVISTYQSVSGMGKDGVDELYNQTKNRYAFEIAQPKIFPKEIAFNLFPHIGGFERNGSTGEENKITQELGKILGDHFKISVTCVRVPVFIGHSMSVNIEFENNISLGEIENILNNQQAINFLPANSTASYLTPVEVTGEDFVHVSRVRDDNSRQNSINLWAVCDNLRKGAALNAVQIAEYMIAADK